MAEEKSSVPKKTPNVTKGENAKPMANEDKIRRSIGRGIIKSMSGFVEAFNVNQKEITKITKANLKETQQGLMQVFSEPMRESDLLANIEDFKAYLEDSGESIQQFGKKAKMSEGRIKALDDTIKDYDKSVKEIGERESALKKAGLVTEQQIVDGKLQLRILTKKEIREKQQQIINNRNLIETYEKDIQKLSKQTDENGQLSVQQKDTIEDLTKNIEELDRGIQDVKNTGVKEVKSVMTGFAGDIADFYGRQRDSVTGFVDAFMPGPVAQVFNSLVQAVEGLVSQVLDLFKPITATIGAIIKAPRFIAKKFFGKTDEQVDEMFKPLKDFGKKVGTFLLKPFKVVGKFMLDMFLRPFKLVALAFKKLGGFMKKLNLGFKLMSLKTMLLVGLFAIIGIAIFMLVKKFDSFRSAIGAVFDRIKDAFATLEEAVISVYDFLFGKTDAERQKEKEELLKKDETAPTAGEQSQFKARAVDQIAEKIREKNPEEYKRGIIGSGENLDNKSLSQLQEIAKKEGVDQEFIDRAEIDKKVARSQREEDKFLQKSRVKFENQYGRESEMSMMNILKNKKLTERLKDNEQFKKFMETKAQFDADQAAMMSGQATTSNVVSNVQNTQTAGVNMGRTQTRNTYGVYNDTNAMSYGNAN